MWRILAVWHAIRYWWWLRGIHAECRHHVSLRCCLRYSLTNYRRRYW